HDDGGRVAVPADASADRSADPAADPAAGPDRGWARARAMIALTQICKQYGRRILLVDASFQLNPGEKVGLVGPNGSGKTTIFRMITGEESADAGEVSVPKRVTVGYFRQDVEAMRGRPV